MPTAGEPSPPTKSKTVQLINVIEVRKEMLMMHNFRL